MQKGQPKSPSERYPNHGIQSTKDSPCGFKTLGCSNCHFWLVSLLRVHEVHSVELALVVGCARGSHNLSFLRQDPGLLPKSRGHLICTYGNTTPCHFGTGVNVGTRHIIPACLKWTSTGTSYVYWQTFLVLPLPPPQLSKLLELLTWQVSSNACCRSKMIWQFFLCLGEV